MFALTPMGALLQSNAESSLRHWTIWSVRHLWPLWSELRHSVTTGESARNLLLGTTGFEHLESDEPAAMMFGRAMAEVTRFVSKGLIQAYDFSRTKRVADIGGGYGELLATTLGAHHLVSGVLFDRPYAISGARDHLESAGVLERCELVAGDFFESVPVRSDAYLLKSVLHDWDDEGCELLLRNCRNTMPQDATLLVIEQVMPECMEVSRVHQDAARKDLSMLIGPGGRERTLREFEVLLRSTEFRIRRVAPLPLNFTLIEAIPSDSAGRK